MSFSPPDAEPALFIVRQRLLRRFVVCPCRPLQIDYALLNVLPDAQALGVHHPQAIVLIGRVLAFLQVRFSPGRVLLAAISQQIADSQQIILDRFRFRILLQPLNRPRIVHSRTTYQEYIFCFRQEYRRKYSSDTSIFFFNTQYIMINEINFTSFTIFFIFLFIPF